MDNKKIIAIIDQGCKFEGNLTFNGLAKISGVVNGSIVSTDTLIIAESAEINADITANVILIFGRVTGNIKASSRVEIKSPANFEGTVLSPSLVVEEGVIFHGTTKMRDVI